MKAIQQLLAGLTTTLFFLAVLLISAGRLSYWQGWLYGAISVLMNLSTRLVLRNNPALVRERTSLVHESVQKMTRIEFRRLVVDVGDLSDEFMEIFRSSVIIPKGVV